MRRSVAVSLVAAITALAQFTIAVACASEAPAITQFLKIRTPAVPVLMPNGSLLQRDWPDGVWQLYRVTPKTAGANASYTADQITRTRLTDFPDGLSTFSLSPDGSRCLLMHARGGNENTQISIIDPMAPGIAPLTPVVANPRVRSAVNAWLRDGSGFFYSANEENPNDFYLYLYDFATAKSRRILGESGSWRVAGVTQDKSRILLAQDFSASDSRVWEMDLKTGARRDITLRPKDGTASCNVVGYLPGDQAVLMTSDMVGGGERLYRQDLKSGKVTEPIPALAKFELDGAALNDRRDLFMAVTNEGGYAAPHFYTAPAFKPLESPVMERGVVSASEFRGSSLVWSMSNARSAGAAFVSTFTPGSSPVTRQLTWTENAGIDLSGFRLPDLIQYPAFDGKSIPAFVYMPEHRQPGTPIPFVIIYHGGPEGQNRPGFSATTQFLVAHGYGVMMPNVRGSTGYGREFEMLDNYKKRWDSVRDGVDAAEWLVKQGYSSPGMISTYGGSYGGFMSVACVVEDQERVDSGARKARLFGACVDVVGIVNMQTFLEKTSDYRRKLREVEYGPLSDPEFLKTISSIHKADKINVPVFIGHGFNDPRVPVEEAMQLAVALKDRKQSPRLFIAPDEGHGFQKLENRIYFNERVVQFLDETIGVRKPMSMPNP